MSFSPELFKTQCKAKGIPDEEIQSRLDYALKISYKSYPVIFNREHLSLMIGIDKKRLVAIENNINTNYKFFKLVKKRKKNGELQFREIMVPDVELKYIQTWILNNILSELPIHDACKSYRKSISIKDHALIHQNKKYVLKIDLCKFFDAINHPRVQAIFENIGYDKSLSITLANLSTNKHLDRYWSNLDPQEKVFFDQTIKKRVPVLPQGAPTSPILSNHILNKMDIAFTEMGRSLGFDYSRYADDLAFSCNSKSSIPNINSIKSIIESNGFIVNNSKTQLMLRGKKQYLTGLSITNGVHVPRTKKREIAQHLYFAKEKGVTDHLNYLDKKRKSTGSRAAFQDWLFGNIMWIKSIDPVLGNKFLQQYRSINWFIPFTIPESGETTLD